MKTFLVGWLMVLGLVAGAWAQQPVPPPASQAEVDAGLDTFKYVTPATLGATTLVGTNSGISAATATNIAAFQAFLATNGFFQPIDSDLTSIAALTTTAHGRGLLDDANAAASRTSIGVVIGTDVQAYDADLGVIGGLADPNADRLLFWDDSAGAYAYLTAGSGLSISGTTITASGGSSAFPLTANADVAGFAVSNVFVIRGRDGATLDGEVSLETRSGNSGIRLTNEGGMRLSGNVHIDGVLTADDGVNIAGTLTVPQVDTTTGYFTNMYHATYNSGLLAIQSDGQFVTNVSSAMMRGSITDESGTGAALFAGGDIAAGTATTASANDNDTSIATTAFVQSEIANTTTITLDGITARTNLFTINGPLYLGTNFTYTSGAATGGLTGVGGTVGSTELFAQLTIKTSGDLVFTNPAAFYTSDGVDTRTFTNGNLTTVLVHVIPGFSTNLTYSWSR